MVYKIFFVVLVGMFLFTTNVYGGSLVSPYDINSDGIIDITDLNAIHRGLPLPREAGPGDNDIAPYPPDGIIDELDLVAVGLRFGCVVGESCYYVSPFDLDEDGLITIKDATYVAARFGFTPDATVFDKSVDYDRNGIIDIADIGMVTTRIGCQLPDACYFGD